MNEELWDIEYAVYRTLAFVPLIQNTISRALLTGALSKATYDKYIKLKQTKLPIGVEETVYLQITNISFKTHDEMASLINKLDAMESQFETFATGYEIREEYNYEY